MPAEASLMTKKQSETILKAAALDLQYQIHCLTSDAAQHVHETTADEAARNHDYCNFDCIVYLVVVVITHYCTKAHIPVSRNK